uniref:BLUF domain-containing protein n=1 Tax=Oncorhynchus tshawytscha TaxID=74940 RepID=A0A8C8MBQ6_ONCTS
METSSQLLSLDQKKEEDVGTSLFHCHMKQRRLFNPQEEMVCKFLLHRLIVVSSLPQQLADRKDLGVHYEELNQRLQRYYQGDAITGLLLLYPTCMLHVIESSSEVLVSLLQDLRDMQERPHCVLIEAPRVLVMSHDLPSRLFQQWSYKVLNVLARVGGMLSRDGPEEEEEEDTDTLVSTTLSMLLKLGNHLLKATKGSKMPLGSVLDEVPEMLVPQDILVQLLSREDLLSPQQYLQAYHTPLHILIDSGHAFGSSQLTTV